MIGYVPTRLFFFFYPDSNPSPLIFNPDPILILLLTNIFQDNTAALRNKVPAYLNRFFMLLKQSQYFHMAHFICVFIFVILCTSVNTSKTNFHCFLQGTIKFF